MNDEANKGESKNPKRQDRLKLALRENLKRRKSQARGRSQTTARNDEPPPRDANEKKRSE
jgi:hypothetical protein